MIAGRRSLNILNSIQGCKRNPPKYVKDVVTLNFELMNCQSLKDKLSSLSENFKMKNVPILSSETSS